MIAGYFSAAQQCRAKLSFWRQAYLERFSYAEQEEDWRALLASPGGDILLVAEDGSGELAGYALGRPGPADGMPYDSVLVALHVRQARQRQGTGHGLLAAMADALKQRGCSSLMLWVLEANPARLLRAPEGQTDRQAERAAGRRRSQGG